MALRFVFNGTSTLLDYLDPETVSPEVLRDTYLLSVYPDLRDASFQVYVNEQDETVYEYKRLNGDKG